MGGWRFLDNLRDLWVEHGFQVGLSVTLPTGVTNMVDDQKLTEHFTLYDLTATSHFQYQEMNRQINDFQIGKLRSVAELAEALWVFLDAPLVASSGYRCPALNQAVGSSPRSQHLLCEAIDMIPKGMAVEDAFKKLRQAAKEKKFFFGQLIYEKAARSYAGGVVEWIHVSLGPPYRDPTRCGEILTMNDGSYVLLETVSRD
jgi:zinc D-Ala-D-Ala carboxypeptidase